MIWAIYIKDMKSFFKSPLGHVVTGLFCLIVGWLFLNQLDYFVTEVQKLPVNMRNEYDYANHVIIKLLSNINFLFVFIIPIITMRSFSDEYKDKTMDLLYSSRASDYQIVLAKFLACFSQGAYLLSMTLIFPLLLGELGDSDIAFFLTGYLGLLFNLLLYTALGLLASSFSQHQMMSVLFGFVFVFMTWMVGWLPGLTSNYALIQVLNAVSINFHFSYFLRGLIHLSDICFYVTATAFSLFLIKKKLESRLW